MPDVKDQPSFEEGKQPPLDVPVLRYVAPTKVKLGKSGRLVIPAALRAEMDVADGDVLMLRVIDGELHVLGPKAATRRLRAIAAPYKRPGVSEVDEFLKKRRKMWGEDDGD
jgi:AbrB family looped-hinge helix DNA binding protein